MTLSWDDRAEQSYDPFLREFDFEGYMIYRSTEPNFRENLLVTDAYGNPIYQRPLAQYDLVNGIRGLHPVPVNGVQFNLGTDSGLRHSYVDRDVINGQTYYYALVAYDRGLAHAQPRRLLPDDARRAGRRPLAVDHDGRHQQRPLGQRRRRTSTRPR